MKQSSKTQGDTVGRILNAAETLFVVHGFADTSMRMITQRAQVNLAAINYYFASKDALFQRVFIRRLNPFIDKLLAQYQALQVVPGKIGVETIVEVLFTSLLRLQAEDAGGGFVIVRLLSRTLVESHEGLSKVLPNYCAPLVERLLSLLQQALPHLEEATLKWRLYFALTSVIHAFAGNDLLNLLDKGEAIAMDIAQIARQLQLVMVASLSAPTMIID